MLSDYEFEVSEDLHYLRQYPILVGAVHIYRSNKIYVSLSHKQEKQTNEKHLIFEGLTRITVAFGREVWSIVTLNSEKNMNQHVSI